MSYQADEQKPRRSRGRLVGVLEGKISISPDFDDTLEYISERERLVLEAMRMPLAESI